LTRKAIDETNRRRKIQLKFNKEHNITPETIRKEIRKSLTEQIKARQTAREAVRFGDHEYEKVELAGQIEKEMLEAAKTLDFERAAFLRDQLRELKDLPEFALIESRKKKRDFIATKKLRKQGKKNEET
jgi:excinuclease ABC subunit B